MLEIEAVLIAVTHGATARDEKQPKQQGGEEG